MFKKLLITAILTLSLLLFASCSEKETTDDVKNDLPKPTQTEAAIITEENIPDLPKESTAEEDTSGLPDESITEESTPDLPDESTQEEAQSDEAPMTEEYTPDLPDESTKEEAQPDTSSQGLSRVLSFLSENGLESFDSESLSYKGKIYSPHYDSWFYSWLFTEGDFKGYEVCVEESVPERIYIASSEKTEENIYPEDTLYEETEKTEQVIRKPSGQIIGYIYTDADGVKTVKEFSGRIRGYYYPDRDVTTDYTGRIFTKGDAASALLFAE